MDKCPYCNGSAIVGKTYPEFRNDDTPEVNTELWIHRIMLCVNPKCKSYCGTDLNNPLATIGDIANKEYEKE